MNKLKLLIITVVCLMPSMVMPFISFDLLVKDGKLVFILGDAHNVELDSFNRDSVRLFIAETQKHQVDKKIDCFIELNEQIFEMCKNTEDNSSILAEFEINAKGEGGTFLELAKTRFKNNILNFHPIEFRNKEADALYGTLYGIETKIFSWTKADQIKNQRFNFNQFKLSFRSHILNSSLTLAQYINKIKTNYSIVKSILKSLEDDNSNFLNVIKKYCIKYGKALQEIINLFKNENDSKSFAEILIDLFKNCSTLEDSWQKYNEIKNLLSIKSDAVFADILFFNTLIRNQELNTKTIFIVGNAHAEKLVKMSLEIGYTHVLSDTCNRKTPDGKDYFKITSDYKNKLGFLSQLIFKIKDEAICLMPELINKFINFPNKAFPRNESTEKNEIDNIVYKCNFCNKKSDDKAFKQCSGCKQVHYCSPKCQKYDWEFHKNICNYITGKHNLVLKDYSIMQ
ncbi:MAG: zinc finger MYND domain-containing protein [Candidatus Babeliales bacterium]|nr:zinc finger MYND domain-containing protein [Candidatus Babeliales bacterium]